MPQDTHQASEHKESFFQKIFDHHHKHGHEGQDAKDVGKPQGGEGGMRSVLKNDEAGLKEYLKKDEELEQQGRTYGGLM